MAFGIYPKIERIGLFKFGLFDHVFIKMYFLYKSKLENFDLTLISKHINSNSYIVDVGANIGWFTLNIGQIMKPGVKILAVEPDLINLRRLKHSVARSELRDQVQILPIALSNARGVGYLILDPTNPANHQVGNPSSSTKEIQLERLDDVCKDLEDVSLLKIDVQGHELKVLEGGRQTILKFKPTILIEFDNRKGNETTLRVLEMLKEFKYEVFLPLDQTLSLSIGDLIHKQGYFDCVCIPK
jgi:FkbM family methyltransferase